MRTSAIVKGNNLVGQLVENILAGTAAANVAAVSAALLIAALLLANSAAAAQIYKHTDENGNVVFTDMPPRPGENTETVEVEVATPNSFETPDPLRVDPDAWIVDPADADTEVAAFSYQYSRITSPADDASVRENAGNVTLKAEIVPNLRTGHQLRLVIDSTVQQVTRTPYFQLTNVDRGTHVARVDVVDAAGKVLLSGQPSTFHLLRVAQSPPRPTPLPTPVSPPRKSPAPSGS